MQFLGGVRVNYSQLRMRFELNIVYIVSWIHSEKKFWEEYKKVQNNSCYVIKKMQAHHRDAAGNYKELKIFSTMPLFKESFMARVARMFFSPMDKVVSRFFGRK